MIYHTNQDDGSTVYANGKYALTVELTMTKTITIYEHPNDDNAIEEAVADWINDNVMEAVECDYEVVDIEEVEDE